MTWLELMKIKYDTKLTDLNVSVLKKVVWDPKGVGQQRGIIKNGPFCSVEFNRGGGSTSVNRFFAAHHKIGDQKYVFAYDFNGCGEPTYCGFAWIVSDAVAEAMLLERSTDDTDDNASPLPPNELFPFNELMSHCALVEYGKQKHRKTFKDVEYRKRMRTVWFGDFIYCFGRLDPLESDYPFAILVDRRPWKRDVEEHAPCNARTTKRLKIWLRNWLSNSGTMPRRLRS